MILDQKIEESKDICAEIFMLMKEKIEIRCQPENNVELIALMVCIYEMAFATTIKLVTDATGQDINTFKNMCFKHVDEYIRMHSQETAH